MQKLSRENLYGLEEYSALRSGFRDQLMLHKKDRRVSIGPNAMLHFEDYMTMRYQVQEMLRAERIFEAPDIEEEIAAYNPLIPDGSNWKATFMIEYADADERKAALARMIGIEDRVWVRVDGFDRVWAIADEDLERDTAEKTSSVHFLRFELTPQMGAAARAGVRISAGIEHDAYSRQVEAIPENVRASLAGDLD